VGSTTTSRALSSPSPGASTRLSSAAQAGPQEPRSAAGGRPWGNGSQVPARKALVP